MSEVLCRPVLMEMEGALRQVFHAFPWKGGLALVPAIITTYFHADTALFVIWFSFVMIDLLLGTIRAVVYHSFRRQRLYRGVLKLATHILLIAVMGCTYQAFFLATGIRFPFVSLFVLVLLTTDSMSIITHMTKLGMPVPGFVKAVVWKMRSKALNGIATGLDSDVESLCQGAARGWGATERRAVPREDNDD